MIVEGFWSKLNKPVRVLFIFLSVCAGSSIIYWVLAQLGYLPQAIDWELKRSLETLSAPIHQLSIFLTDISIEGDFYIVKQYFDGSPIQPQIWSSYILFGTLSLWFIVYPAVISGLNRFYHLLGSGLLLVSLVLLRLDQLLIFGLDNKYFLLLSMLLFIGPGYYFNNFAQHIGFHTRILTSFVMLLIWVSIIIFFSALPNPIISLTHHGLLVPCLLSLAFIIVVGHEPLHAILYTITRHNTFSSKNSLTHFLLGSFIYLATVLIQYLSFRNYIRFDVFFPNEYTWLLIAGIFGLYGIVKRKNTYERITSVSFAILIYMLLFTTTFVTISFALLNAHDALLEAFKDVILLSFFCLGLMFFFYVMMNFSPLLEKNHAIYKVLFQPTRLPWLYSRFFALILIAAGVFAYNYSSYYKARVSQYDAIADSYFVENKMLDAETYYRLANRLGYKNHRSSYSIFTIAKQKKNTDAQITFLKEPLSRMPSPYAYASLANIYKDEGRFFDALFTLQEGKQQFPDNNEINNNLGLIYGQTTITDSTSFYFNQLDNEVAIANRLAIEAEKGINIGSKLTPSSLLGQINLMAKRIVFGKNDSVPLEIPENFDWSGYVWYNNAFLSSALPQLPSIPQLESVKIMEYKLKEDFEIAWAWHQYHHGNIMEAFSKLEHLYNNSIAKKAVISSYLAFMALEQNSPRLALYWFNKIQKNKTIEISLGESLAWLRLGDLDAAITSLPDLDSTVTNVLLLGLKNDLQTISNWHGKDLSQLSDYQKYLIISMGELSLEKTIKTKFDNEGYLAAAMDEQILNLFCMGKYQSVVDWFSAKSELFENTNAASQKYFQNSLLELDHKINPLNLKGIDSLLVISTKDSVPEELITMASQNPFDAWLLIKVVFKLNAANRSDKAYQLLLHAYKINPYNKQLNEGYILQCYQMGYNSYSESAMERYFEFAEAEVKEALKEKIKLIQQAQESWSQ